MSLDRQNSLVKPGRKFAYQQVGITTAIVFIITLVTYFSWGLSSAVSALAGGAIGIIPNIIFAYKAFRFAGAKSSKLVVESFFSGVKLKMVVTALLFSLAFKFLVIVPLPFFSMFCLVMALPLLTPFILKHQH
ncbi:ATP synthase subunit I [Colwellia hornerae]|uniref:F0F1 ATP synthase assembly protein I n=1 Tax=Colwellia hornerae TaxID=89402 RepID=A0A5C6Q6W9_9GAMM|nr:ATP synthase subunit I [Colwellia hornerae]TWX49133.1 F0F1 ATP synthase assembly protein I [Colwellia hornerae]TWX55560.1 F0F1 ATP synthase assembly protein I [Colwellia hornerae]TWX64462.1 F0F1 ATP synthase assembly protein I [Colwellia hornerae]